MPPPTKQYRELTFSSIFLAVLVGLVLNAGICFAGLQIGFTIVGSTVAAVMGFGILRGLMRKGSILEVNIFQTVASAVNTVNAGVIFTVPVLFILGMSKDIDYTALILAATAGSLLGVVMIIPLRKQIIDYERLRFPEGTAVASILKSPGAGVQKAILLVVGIAIAATVSGLKHFPLDAPLLAGSLHLGKHLSFIPPGFSSVFAISLLSIGAGFLAGRPGLVVLYGTLLNYWILIPACLWLGWVPAKYRGYDLWFRETGVDSHKLSEAFVDAFSHFTSRNVGIGMILGGAVAGIILAAPALKSALGSLKKGAGGSGVREELPISVLNGGLLAGGVLMLLATKLSGGDHVSWGTALLVTVVGGVWLWVAGLVVAQTTGRTDWSPLSGLALIAIAIMMGIMGTGDEFIVPAVTIGAAICVATSMCADMMTDLKTGYLVGSRPIRQQIAQIATCWIGPAFSVAIVIVLWEAYAFGPDQAKILHDRAEQASVAENDPSIYDDFLMAGGSETSLPKGVPPLGAPQAGALQGAIRIVQSGDIALGKYLTGAALGLLTSILVSPGLGVMVGLSLYLPFEYMAVFGLGGIACVLLRRWKGARFTEDKGVPFAAGLIVGDAVVEVMYAVIKVSMSL